MTETQTQGGAFLITGDDAGHLTGLPRAYGPDEEGTYGVWLNSRRDAWRASLSSLHPPRVSVDLVLPGWIDVVVAVQRPFRAARPHLIHTGNGVQGSGRIGWLAGQFRVTWPVRAIEHIYRTKGDSD